MTVIRDLFLLLQPMMLMIVVETMMIAEAATAATTDALVGLPNVVQFFDGACHFLLATRPHFFANFH